MSKEHIHSGKFSAVCREGDIKEFPLTSISLAGVLGTLFNFEDIEKLSGHLASVKKDVKKVLSSSYILNKI
ncbi:hypothetical protein EZV73_03405 [Acidaminobacter sp. JC074]|uniref:hypothetical protein n=1 Tax=Acidaminobacter sp. JC074 TaxID=2530199 RepID=UPI001F10544F|nr:hypothetical protein [Acidaminobacter sp. JC074]MCH4886597.1 hypothetical protein [Acidaminobacter sp. JC074]